MVQQLRVGERLGWGWELRCHRLLDAGGQPTQQCVKVLHGGGEVWQRQDAEFWHGNLRLAKDVMDPSLEVVEDVELVFDDGTVKRAAFVVLQDYYEDYAERVLKLEDFGREDLVQMIEVIKLGHNLRVEHQRGLDLMGGALALDVVKAVPQLLVSSLLRGKLDHLLPGVLGQARNVIRMDGGKLVCADLGMHDLSEGAKFGRTNGVYNAIVFAGLIEVVRFFNQRLPEGERFSESEIDGLPCVANPGERAVAKVLLKRMMPLFELRSVNLG